MQMRMRSFLARQIFAEHIFLGKHRIRELIWRVYTLCSHGSCRDIRLSKQRKIPLADFFARAIPARTAASIGEHRKHLALVAADFSCPSIGDQHLGRNGFPMLRQEKRDVIMRRNHDIDTIRPKQRIETLQEACMLDVEVILDIVRGIILVSREIFFA